MMKNNPSSGLITLMMEAVSTSETSVNFYQTTRRSIPEDSLLQLYTYLQEMIPKSISLLLKSLVCVRTFYRKEPGFPIRGRATITRQVKKRNERGLTSNTPQNATIFSQLHVNLIRKEKLVFSISDPFSEHSRDKTSSEKSFSSLVTSCGREDEL
jgi:hypothetical protein